MKKSLFLVAATAMASVAGTVEFGINALAGYNILSVGDDVGTGLFGGNPTRQASFGVAVGPVVSVPLNEQFGIDGGVSFQYDMNRYENKFDAGILGSNKDEHTLNQMSLGLQAAPSFRISDKFKIKVGYEWDMPLGGTNELKRTTTVGPLTNTTTTKPDIVWAPGKLSDVKSNESPVLSTHNIILGGSYALLPNLAFVIQGKFGLTGSIPNYKANGDLDGAASTKSNIMTHQIALGINLGFN